MYCVQRSKDAAVEVWNVEKGTRVALLSGHRFGVMAVAFSPSGHTLISVGYRRDKTVCAWDWEIQQCRAKGRLPAATYSVAAQLDGTGFVTCGEGYVGFWRFADASSGGAGMLTCLPAPLPAEFASANFVDICTGAVADSDAPGTFAVASDGRLAAFSNTRQLQLYVPLKTQHAFAVSCAAGCVLVSCSDSTVRVFDSHSLKCRGSLPVPPAVGQQNITSAAAASAAAGDTSGALLRPAAVAGALSSDGTHATIVYGDRSLFVWSIAGMAQGKVVKQRAFFNHASTVWGITFLPSPASLHRLSADDGAVNASLAGHSPLPEGTFVTVGGDCTARFWNLDSRAVGAMPPVADAARSDGHGRAVQGRNVYSSNMLHVLYCSEDDSSPPSGFTYDAQGRAVDTPAYSTSSWVAQSVIRAPFDLEKGFPSGANSGMRSVAAACYPAASAALPCDSLVADRGLTAAGYAVDIAVGDRQGNVRVFDTWRMKQVQFVPAHDGEVLGLAYAPATSCVVASSGQDGLIHLFDVRRGYAHAGTLDRHEKPVCALSFSQDDAKLLSAGGDAKIVFNRLRIDGASPVGLQMARQLQAQGVDMPSGMTWQDLAAPGTGAATPGTPAPGSIDIAGEHIELSHSRTVSVPHGSIMGLAVDATNKNVATVGQDKRLHVHSLRNGRLLRTYAEAPGVKLLNAVAVDPSGMFVATAGGDNAVRVHDFFSGQCIACLAAHASKVTGMAWSPDCKRLITTGMDGCIMVWRLDPDLARLAAARQFEIAASRTKALTERAIALTEARAGLAKPTSAAVPVQQEGGGAEPPTGPPTTVVSVPPPVLPPPPAATAAASPQLTGGDSTVGGFGRQGGALPIWAQSIAPSGGGGITSARAPGGVSDSIIGGGPGGRWAHAAEQSMHLFGADAQPGTPASDGEGTPPPQQESTGGGAAADEAPLSLDATLGPAGQGGGVAKAAVVPPPAVPSSSPGAAAAPAADAASSDSEDERAWADADAASLATPARAPPTAGAPPSTGGVRQSLSATFAAVGPSAPPTASRTPASSSTGAATEAPSDSRAAQQASALSAIAHMRENLKALDLLRTQNANKLKSPADEDGAAGEKGTPAKGDDTPPDTPTQAAERIPSSDTPPTAASSQGDAPSGALGGTRGSLAATLRARLQGKATQGGGSSSADEIEKAHADTSTAPCTVLDESVLSVSESFDGGQSAPPPAPAAGGIGAAAPPLSHDTDTSTSVSLAGLHALQSLEDSSLLPSPAAQYAASVSALQRALQDTLTLYRGAEDALATSMSLSSGGSKADLDAAQALTFALRDSLADAAKALSSALPPSALQASTPQGQDAEYAATAPLAAAAATQEGGSAHSDTPSPMQSATAPLHQSGQHSPAGASHSGMLSALAGSSDASASGVDLEQLADLLFAKMAPKLQESMQRDS